MKNYNGLELVSKSCSNSFDHQEHHVDLYQSLCFVKKLVILNATDDIADNFRDQVFLDQILSRLHIF